MRSRSAQGKRGAARRIENDFDEDGRIALLLERLGWSGKDAIGFIMGAFAACAILVNVLFLQSGPHPAPLFTSAHPAPVVNAPPQALPVALRNDGVAALPRARPADSVPARTELPAALSRPPGEIILDIQRELARRGFYDGPADGIYGPKTDAAIREFEQAAALKSSAEPNEALLRAIVKSNVMAAKAAPAAAAPAVRPVPPRMESPAEPPAGSKRVAAVQRALSEWGYGQIKPTGVVDGDTQAAIEKFERARRLPITRQVSDRVVRELAAVTGRPLE